MTGQTLTEIEALGLESRHDLANGHASQELPEFQQAIVKRLPELWESGAKIRSGEAERRFKEAFRRLSSCPSLAGYGHFKIAPTASCSIDLAAVWLAEKKLKTALLEPTFDNLCLILKRRGVALEALPEPELHGGAWDKALDRSRAGAVFIVNPNNPTGKVLSREQFQGLVEWCARNKKVLVLDNTFRFFMPQDTDHYQILLDSGVSFISIEDTGKVWPTQEIKASLLFCSPDIIREMEVIYDEIFLCPSNFALAVLGEFLKDALERGLAEAVWKEVAERRIQFRQALDGEVLSVHPEALKSRLSVEWVRIGPPFKSDWHLAQHFKAKNLVLLPGRPFYWSRPGAVTHCARFALLKPKADFLEAVAFLSQELWRLGHE
ncbi:MAG: aminotransferase class I/II-fold pyridoxal phosphate-dependent enzyme [Elusimicrobia bacterium]|nr:aminotransferase class I/II-fold pyridoxal phosphate-dependent enzyme [Elusimicrobiota bacterium]